MTNLEKYLLSLHERCERGEISEEERNVLLEAVTTPDEESTDETEKYIKSINERCESGFISEEERNVLLEAANATNRQYLQALKKLNTEFTAKEKLIKTAIKAKNYEKAKDLIDEAEELLDDMIDEVKAIPEDIEDAIIAQVSSALAEGLTMGAFRLLLGDLKSAIQVTVNWGLFTGFLNAASSVWSYNKGEDFNIYRKRVLNRLNDNRRVLSNLKNKVLKKEIAAQKKEEK